MSEKPYSQDEEDARVRSLYRGGVSGAFAGAAAGTAVAPVIGTVLGAFWGYMGGCAFGYYTHRPKDRSPD